MFLVESLSLARGSCLGFRARDQVGLRWPRAASPSAFPALHSVTSSVHRDMEVEKICSSLICNPQLLPRLCFCCEMRHSKHICTVQSLTGHLREEHFHTRPLLQGRIACARVHTRYQMLPSRKSCLSL